MAGKARPTPSSTPSSPRSPLAGDRGKLIRQMESGQVADAAETFQKGKRWRAEDATLALSLAIMCIAEGLVAQAEATLRLAMRLAPDLHEARLNLAFLLLRESRYEEAWPLYEARTDASSTGIGVPQLPFPRWNGEPLAGRSVVVFAEQGHGDTLQAVRFCALLKAAGARFVQFACPPALEALMATASGVDEVISSPDKLRRHDFWMLAMGLPRYFVRQESDIPRGLPYLHAPANRSAAWQARLGPPGALRVGLVWKGSPQHKLDMVRSLASLRDLAPLWSVPGLQFVSLQKGAGEEEANAPPAAQPLLALGPQVGDFADAAAVVEQLDLVITVDTAMAHLAGALGKPVWVLLPAHLTDWRWLRDRTDSPWYPGVMRLFRQRGLTGWEPVIAELVQALGTFAARGRPAPRAAISGNVLAGRKPAAAPGTRQNAPPPAAQQALAAANALLARGDAAAAEVAYAELLAQWPAFASALNNRGAALSQLGRHEEAFAAFERATQVDAKYTDAWFNLGISHERAGRMQAAADAFTQARALAADPVPVSRRLVGAWMALGELQQALDVLRTTRGWVAEDAVLHTSMGMLMDVNGRPADAEQMYRQALSLAPGSPEARLNLGVALLRIGRFAEGWECYEARHEVAQGWDAVLERPALAYPRWTGQSLTGKSVLIWTEQGFGDAIQFVRYAALLKQRGATWVTVACRSPLRPLLETCPGVDEVVCEGTPLPDHDFWVFALSLPFGCGTTLETIPDRLPYLFARPDRLARWKERIPQGSLRIGLAWKGLPQHRNDLHRSLQSLVQLAPLWSVPGVQFVSLQRGAGSEETAALSTFQPLVHLGEDIQDFGDTAAIVAQLDLVICVDTALAHVAGALGKPVWVLLPIIGTDFRWLRDRDDSPWYPRLMRLYRQDRPGDWDGVVQRIAADLRAWRPTPAPKPAKREPVKLRLTQSGAVLPVPASPGEAEHAYRDGIRLAAAGQTAEAEAAYRKALTLNPHHASAWNNLGNLLGARRAPAEAENAYRQALALQPGHVNALNNLASLLTGLERVAEAEPLIRRAIAASPDTAELHNTLGILLAQKRQEAEAEVAYRRALELETGHPSAANNLGALVMQQGNLDEAESLLQRAVERQPTLADAWINLGFLLRVRRRFGEAEAAYRRAIEIDPRNASAQMNLCFLLLSLGRFEDAWPFHAARYSPQRAQTSTRPPRLPYPAWQGEPLEGKSLLLWPEQGFGDYIQFIRYAALLKQRGLARLSIVCSPVLAELLRTAPGVDAVFTQAVQVPAHDFWLLLMSLPERVGTTPDTIPAQLPYLHALPERIAKWRPRLPAGRRVGLVWKGAAAHRNDRQRSLPHLAALAPLWRVPGLQFVSLQKGEDEAVAAAPPADQPLVAVGADLQDFADSAAVVAQLDLLICVDTAIAHVAGALGKPVWVLLPALGTDWRWQSDRADSPWYPGVMRLFRQPEVGAWDSVVAELCAALADWAKKA